MSTSRKDQDLRSNEKSTTRIPRKDHDPPRSTIPTTTTRRGLDLNLLLSPKSTSRIQRCFWEGNSSSTTRVHTWCMSMTTTSSWCRGCGNTHLQEWDYRRLCRHPLETTNLSWMDRGRDLAELWPGSTFGKGPGPVSRPSSPSGRRSRRDRRRKSTSLARDSSGTRTGTEVRRRIKLIRKLKIRTCRFRNAEALFFTMSI